MNRRLFLRTGSLAGLTLTTTGLTALGNTKSLKDSAINQWQDRIELEEITIDELQQKMKSGHTSSVTITQLYLNRIALIDKAGPTINAVIEINDTKFPCRQFFDMGKQPMNTKKIFA